MGNDHHQEHGPSVAEGYGVHRRVYLVAILVNLAFVLVEVTAGVLAHSLALLADAWHNVGDVLSLLLALGATALARVKPSARRTFGYRRSTIVASVTNAFLLLFVTGGIVWESIQRLRMPVMTEGRTMIAVALLGGVINAFVALTFMALGKKDLNVRAAFLHMASDSMLAFGVAGAGGLIVVTHLYWLDPVASLLLALVILAGAWSLTKKSLNLMLDAVPENIDPQEVTAYLGALGGVVDVHDLHIWAMSTTETALTAHLVMSSRAASPAFLAEAGKALHDRFDIDHTTLQIDVADASGHCACACPLAADE
ncbi:MAG: cation diffusion facilitator family transporter [Polyangiaceae bacterium]